MRMSYRNNFAFSLTEMLTVVVMIAIMGGVIFTVFVTNWEALEDQISRTDMWHEANEIVETMTFDGRVAKLITVGNDAGGNQVADIFDRNDTLIASYKMAPDGRFFIERNGTTKVLSNRIDFTNSRFIKGAVTIDGVSFDTGDSIWVQLTLTDALIRRNISINTTTEIFPRNANSPISGSST